MQTMIQDTRNVFSVGNYRKHYDISSLDLLFRQNRLRENLFVTTEMIECIWETKLNYKGNGESFITFTYRAISHQPVTNPVYLVTLGLLTPLHRSSLIKTVKTSSVSKVHDFLSRRESFKLETRCE